MSILFGGPKFQYSPIGGVTPGLGQKYVDAQFNFDPGMYGGLGGGPFLKGAKADYQAMRNGTDLSKIAGFGSTLNAIKANYAANNAATARNLAMSNPDFANQPGLLAAQQAELGRQENQDQSNTVANAASGFYNQTQNFGQNALENKKARALQAAGMKLQGLGQASNAYFGAYRPPTGQSGGLFGAIGQGLGAAGSLFGGPLGGAIGSGLGSIFSKSPGFQYGGGDFDYAGAPH